MGTDGYGCTDEMGIVDCNGDTVEAAVEEVTGIDDATAVSEPVVGD